MKNTNNTGQNGAQNILEHNKISFEQNSRLRPISLIDKKPVATKTF